MRELGGRDEKAGGGETCGRWMDRFQERFNLTSLVWLNAAQFGVTVAWIKRQQASNWLCLRRTSH